MRKVLVGLAFACLLTLAAVLTVTAMQSHEPPTAQALVTCDRNATPSTFADELAAATAGESICLASGSYGTFQGTSKQVTITAAPGASPTMKVSFGSGDSGFTLDGMHGMGGSIGSGAHDITIRNSAFNSEVSVNGTPAGSNIVFDGNSHNNISGSATSQRFLVQGAVTIRNSHFEGGGSDGVRFASSIPATVEDSVFLNILADGSGNHTDNIQWYGGSNAIVRRNLFKQTVRGEIQIMGAFDGTAGNVIEDNVVDVLGRPWSIELYSDDRSIVRHNTLVYRTGCDYNLTCGRTALDYKAADGPGSGTHVFDNVTTTVGITPSSAGTADHNVSGQNAIYVGGSSPSTWAEYALAADSPVGKGTASDGSDNGIRAGSGPESTPTPTPTSTPSDTPAGAVWTAPTEATVGTPVTLDGTSSTGDAPLACTWRFEYSSGTLVQSRPGCEITFTFQSAGTKYVRLVATDADGDTDSQLRTFTVA